MPNRHTMGNDWGGRGKGKPVGDKTTRQQVLDEAASMGARVRRDNGNYSQWWRWSETRQDWFTCGQTNWECLWLLRNRGDDW